jgi:hypothetical protein
MPRLTRCRETGVERQGTRVGREEDEDKVMKHMANGRLAKDAACAHQSYQREKVGFVVLQ